LVQERNFLHLSGGEELRSALSQVKGGAELCRKGGKESQFTSLRRGDRRDTNGDAEIIPAKVKSASKMVLGKNSWKIK